MSGEVRNGEHFVAQRRHQEQINLREDARHLLRHFTSEPVGLHEVDGGKKPGFTKDIGPRVRRLHFEADSFRR